MKHNGAFLGDEYAMGIELDVLFSEKMILYTNLLGNGAGTGNTILVWVTD